MWRNPRYPAPETPAPPVETGERLATFPRDNGGAELRLTLDSYQGHQFLSLRLWERGQNDSMFPTKKGVSIRLREAAALARVLAEVADGQVERPTTSTSQPRRTDPAPRTSPAGAGAPPRRPPPPATSGSDEPFDEFN